MTKHMRSVLEELGMMAGNTSLDAVAQRLATTNAGAARTLRALEDRGLVRETFNGEWSLR